MACSSRWRGRQTCDRDLGQYGRMFPARSLIVAESLFRFIGATIGETTFRCSSCFGGSMEMKLARRYSIGRSVIEMPPSIASDE